MQAESGAFPVAGLIRSLFGCLVKYVSCGVLTIVLLLCFAALMFAQIALWGPHVWWLAYLWWLLPGGAPAADGATLHGNDLGAALMRAFTLVSLALMALAMLWRWLRPWLRRDSATPDPGGSTPILRHMRRHAGRRFIVGFGLVSAIFVYAFIAIPHARMVAGSSHAGMAFVFVLLYVVALLFTAAYLGIGMLADLILDG